MLERGKAIRKIKKKYQIFKYSEKNNKNNKIFAVRVHFKFIKNDYNISSS
jgi:hypothetical protein